MAEPQAIDVADPPWREVKRWAEERLLMHRRVLEQTGMSHEDTEGIRYAITELKALLNFPNPSKIPTSTSEEPE